VLVEVVFDWAGNVGTTTWWDGQIVGAYAQDDAGQIELIVPRDPGSAGQAGLQAEAERLGDWLDGEKVTALYKSPLVTWEAPRSPSPRHPAAYQRRSRGMGHAVPARPIAGRRSPIQAPFDGDDSHYALLIYCDEDTGDSDREREASRGAVHRDPLRTAGTWRARQGPAGYGPAGVDAAPGGVGVGVVEDVAGPVPVRDWQHEHCAAAHVVDADPGLAVGRWTTTGRLRCRRWRGGIELRGRLSLAPIKITSGSQVGRSSPAFPSSGSRAGSAISRGNPCAAGPRARPGRLGGVDPPGARSTE
jgi:hypothetical protein